MHLKRSCATVYLDTRDGKTRRVTVPVWVAWLGGLGVPAAAAVAVMLALGAGPVWLRGQSPVTRENAALRATMAGLDLQLEELAAEMDGLAVAHDRIADELALPALESSPAASGRAHGPAAAALCRLLDRARAQRAGFGALQDTFSARAALRARVPAINPCSAGWPSSAFGYRNDPFTGRRAFHRGLDISLPVGSPVRATADGRVVAVEKQRGLGLLVKVDHGQGLVTVYGHLDRALVRRGEQVGRGEAIALSGNTGRSTAPHLHYEVQRHGCAVNPRPYLLDFPVASR
jgi:murein DD-endopeptidase MepM/ murein hydrolase activator NlpD